MRPKDESMKEVALAVGEGIAGALAPLLAHHREQMRHLLETNKDLTAAVLAFKNPAAAQVAAQYEAAQGIREAARLQGEGTEPAEEDYEESLMG